MVRGMILTVTTFGLPLLVAGCAPAESPPVGVVERSCDDVSSPLLHLRGEVIPSMSPPYVDHALNGSPGIPMSFNTALTYPHDAKFRYQYSCGTYDSRSYELLIGSYPAGGNAQVIVHNSEPMPLILVGWGVITGRRPMGKTTWVAGSAEHSTLVYRVKSPSPGVEIHQVYFIRGQTGEKAQVWLCTDPEHPVPLELDCFVEATDDGTLGSPRAISSDAAAAAFRQHVEQHAVSARLFLQ